MPKKITFLFLAAFCGLALFASCSKKPETVFLQFNLKKGKTYSSTVQMEQKIEQTVMGKVQSMDQGMEMKVSYVVEDISPEGERTLKMTYDSIRFEQKTPMGKNVYDSKEKNGNTPSLDQVFSPMIGKSLVVKIMKDGTVSSVKGFDKIIDEIARSIPAKTKQQKAMVREMIKEQQKSFAGKETFEQMFKIYPENPVKIGESWENVMALKGSFPLNVKSVYTLKNIRGRRAIVDIHNEIVSAGGSQSLPGNPKGALKVDLKGQGSGHMYIHVKTGWITRSDIEQKITGELKMIPDRDMPQEQAIPINITTKMQLRG